MAMIAEGLEAQNVLPSPITGDAIEITFEPSFLNSLFHLCQPFAYIIKGNAVGIDHIAYVLKKGFGYITYYLLKLNEAIIVFPYIEGKQAVLAVELV